MNNDITLGLMLMVVGMATVFCALLIVIYLGKLLIIFVNKYILEDAVKLPVLPVTAPAVDNRKMAAIVSAVNLLSHGKAKVVKVEKM